MEARLTAAKFDVKLGKGLLRPDWPKKLTDNFRMTFRTLRLAATPNLGSPVPVAFPDRCHRQAPDKG